MKTTLITLAAITRAIMASDFPLEYNATPSSTNSNLLARTFYRSEFYFTKDSTNLNNKIGIFNHSLIFKDSIAQGLLDYDFNEGYVKKKCDSVYPLSRMDARVFIYRMSDSAKEIRWKGRLFGKASLNRVLEAYVISALVVTPFILAKNGDAAIWVFPISVAVQMPFALWPRKYRIVMLD